MRFIFLDDSKQNTPSRPGMGPLVSIGGLSIPANKVRSAEANLNDLCKEFNFPASEPFKWSPGKDLWMRKGLVDKDRQTFFLKMIEVIAAAEAKALVVVSDKKCRTATKASSAEIDVTNLILERIHMHLESDGRDGIVIVDRPGGNHGDEEKYLLNCLEMIQEGAGYVVPQRISINVLSAPSKFVRLLQAADVITSCTLARISGEYTHAPPVFEKIKELLLSDKDKVGGVGLKLHPDFKFANLYHWIVGDQHFWRLNVGTPLPLRGHPYFNGPDIL